MLARPLTIPSVDVMVPFCTRTPISSFSAAGSSEVSSSADADAEADDSDVSFSSLPSSAMSSRTSRNNFSASPSLGTTRAPT